MRSSPERVYTDLSGAPSALRGCEIPGAIQPYVYPTQVLVQKGTVCGSATKVEKLALDEGRRQGRSPTKTPTKRLIQCPQRGTFMRAIQRQSRTDTSLDQAGVVT